MNRILVTIAAAMLFAGQARADDGFAVGDAVQGFALKAVNDDVIGEKLVAIDNYYGPEAKDPKKAILLSFFATYCEPCKKEMPFLAALHQEYGEKGLSVMSVSIDREQEKIEFVKNLAKDSGVKFPVLSDRFNIVAKRYYVEKLPLVYVINSEGKVAMVKTGYTEDATKTIFDEVRRLVGEPASDPVPAAISMHMPQSEASPPSVAAETPEEVAQTEEPKKKKRKRRKRRGKKRRK